MTKQKMIARMPRPLKLGLGRVYGLLPPRIRYGSTFWETYNLLKDSQWWSREKLEQYQMQELRKLLFHSYLHVPYYRRLFDEHGLRPEAIDDFSDLNKIPLLTKEIIRDNYTDLMATNLPAKSFIKSTTGGSSGTPLGFLVQRGYSGEREAAFMATMWDRVGFRYGRDKRLVLRAPHVSNKKRMEYKPDSKELICSTYWMDDIHCDAYFREMTRRKIRFIHGHVSSIISFAQFIIKEGYSCNLQGVLGASEKVYPFQRKIVRDAFQTGLFSWFGNSEQAVLAGECELSTYYHAFPEYGLMELIDEEGNIVNAPGGKGEIVGTSFNNYAMPFIRYYIGDVAKYASVACNCGREYPLLEDVEGRSYEYVLTEDGRKVSLTGLIFGQHFEAFERIKKIQLYQESKGKLEIRIVKSPGYTPRDEHEIKATIEEAVGSGLAVEFCYVDDILRTARGKHQYLIQELQF